MKVIINRLDYQAEQTLGELTVYDGIHRLANYKTMELPWLNNKVEESCIPPREGMAVIKHNSPKFGKSFWVKDVLDRKEILIHYGNYNRDTRGCILPGQSFTDIDGDGLIDVTYSKKSISQLWNILPDLFYLHIFGTPPDVLRATT